MDASYLKKYAERNGMPCIDCDGRRDNTNACKGKPQKKQALQASQVIVHAIASLHARGTRITQHSRGLLVWHSTGSGKTCAATCIMDAFWDTDSTLYFVTSPSALQSNPPSAFHDCARMLPRFADADVARTFEDRKIAFTTFAKMAHATGLHRPNKHVQEFGRSPVFIVDEAHSMFRPLMHQRAEMAAILNYFATHDSKLFLLTGTPGDSVQDVLRIVNLLVPRSSNPLTYPNTDAAAHAFVKTCRYMVTHYDAVHDKTVFPHVSTQEVKTRMSNVQFSRYVEAMKATAQEDRDYSALKQSERLSRFFASARRFANALFKKDDIPLPVAAAKVMAMVDKIVSQDYAKHYVYSAFSDDRGTQSQGIHLVAHALRLLGYQQLTADQAAVVQRYPENPPLLRKRRFVVLTGKELGKKKTEALQNIVSVFNWPANATGDYVHVVLASQEYNESVDFKAIQHIHILDPMLSVSSMQQTIGRAVRRCSHDQLPIESRRVTITKYIAASPQGDATIDEQVDATIALHHKEVGRLLALLRLAAMDCVYFKHFHSIKHSCVSELTP